MAHPNCVEGHVCQRLSGRICIEEDCAEPAGTLWGPLWCPDHDQERLELALADIVELKARLVGGVS